MSFSIFFQVENDVDGIDVNMGCPKQFSLKGFYKYFNSNGSDLRLAELSLREDDLNFKSKKFRFCFNLGCFKLEFGRFLGKTRFVRIQGWISLRHLIILKTFVILNFKIKPGSLQSNYFIMVYAFRIFRYLHDHYVINFIANRLDLKAIKFFFLQEQFCFYKLKTFQHL